MPLVRADSEAELKAVMRRYREGIVESWGDADSEAEPPSSTPSWPSIGGEKLVGKGDRLAPGTFWPSLTF